MVATSDFSGLVSSTWALARAAAMVAMVSLERCMAGALHGEQIKVHGAGFRASGPDPMPDRLLGVLRHEAFELRLRVLMLDVSLAGATKDVGAFRPGIR